MATNYLGAAYCSAYALPHLKKSNGMIVVISSIQGKIPVIYHSGYVASKYALQGFFETLRDELKRQVDVLIVSPAWIQGTQLKQHAYTNDQALDQEIIAKHQGQALTLEYCTRHIIKAMRARQRELILPGRYRWLPWLKMLCPGLLSFFVNKRVERH
jgi:short-subunit dehydrogenase